MSSRRAVLFSYQMPFDNGSIPNPFGEFCTLALGYPEIRQEAEVGDWIVGTGTQDFPVRGGKRRHLAGHVVFAMKISEKVSLLEYDQLCQAKMLEKIPRWDYPEKEMRLGDCIYDFSGSRVVQRRGCRRKEDIAEDLAGGWALLSHEFWYFGIYAQRFPPHLNFLDAAGKTVRVEDKEAILSLEVWLQTFHRDFGSLFGLPLCGILEAS